jgi:hypothetical protein
VNETKIIPADLQDQLFALRDRDTNSAWRLGDLTNEVIKYNFRNATGASLMEIYKAVASVAGRASRTVREYQATAARFDQNCREQYDVLAFGHFRIASRLEQPLAALDWAVEQVASTGKPATIDAMELMFKSAEQSEPEELVDPLDKILSSFGALRDYVSERRDRLPGPVVERIWRNLETLESDLRGVAVLMAQ